MVGNRPVFDYQSIMSRAPKRLISYCTPLLIYIDVFDMLR